MRQPTEYRYVNQNKKHLSVQVTSECGSKSITRKIPLNSYESTIRDTINDILIEAGNSKLEVNFKASHFKRSENRITTKPKAKNITGLLGVSSRVNKSSVSFRGGYQGVMGTSYSVKIRHYPSGISWIKKSDLKKALNKATQEAESARGTNRPTSELLNNKGLEELIVKIIDIHQKKFKHRTLKKLYLAEFIEEIAELDLIRVVPKDIDQLNEWLKHVTTDRESLVDELRANKLSEKNIKRVLEGKKVLHDIKKRMKPNKFGYKDVNGSPLKDRIHYKFIYGTGAKTNYALLNKYIDGVYYILEDDLKQAFVAACKERDIATGELIKTEEEYAKFYKPVDWANEYKLKNTFKNVHVVKSLSAFERDVFVRIPDTIGSKAESRLTKKTHRENRAGYIGLLLITSHEYVYYRSSVYKNGNTKKGARFGVALNVLGHTTRWLNEVDLKQAYLNACKDYDTLKGLNLLDDEEYLHVYKEVDWLDVMQTQCIGSKITNIVVAKNKSDAKRKINLRVS